MEVGVISNWIPATPSSGKDNQCPIVPETRCVIHAVSAGLMWGRNTAKVPRSTLVLAHPALHVTFPSAMRGLVEYGGDDCPIRHLRQNWPCANIVNGYVSLCGHAVPFPQSTHDVFSGPGLRGSAKGNWACHVRCPWPFPTWQRESGTHKRSPDPCAVWP